jgi:hypothetical protein
MTLIAWTLVMAVASAVCAFTVKAPNNPLKGFLPSRLFLCHICLGGCTICLAIAALVKS